MYVYSYESEGFDAYFITICEQHTYIHNSNSTALSLHSNFTNSVRINMYAHHYNIYNVVCTWKHDISRLKMRQHV